ncbi:MAG: cation:proton antiporter [Bacteroidetes bacterium]|nr:cation:proton antiporter [Bacteroidota bacterium]
MAITVLTIGLLVFVAHLFTALFEKTRIPDVLLLMLIGIIAGPVFHIVESEDFGKVGVALTTIALTVILFEGGTTLEIPTIIRSASETLALTLVSFVVTVAIGVGIMVGVFQTDLMTGLVLGIIIGGTSSAVVVPMVKGLKMKEPAGTVLVLESSLTDVLCIVLVAGVLEAMVSTNADTGKIIGGVLSSFLFATVNGVLGGHLWLFLLDKVRRFPNTIFTTFAFIFILYGFSEMLGFSGAITALSFGVTLTNFRYFRFNRLPMLKGVEWSLLNDTERKFYSEVVFLLKIFFFVYLGISMQLDGFEAFFWPGVFVLSIYAARLIVTRLVVSSQIPWYERSVMSIMVPKGLAAAVLAGLPAHYGIPAAGLIQDIVYRIIFISIVLTALLVPLLDKTPIYRFIFAVKENEPADV